MATSRLYCVIWALCLHFTPATPSPSCAASCSGPRRRVCDVSTGISYPSACHASCVGALAWEEGNCGADRVARQLNSSEIEQELEEEEEEEEEVQEVLVFLVFSLASGIMSQWLISRYMQWLPYTVMLLLIGIGVGFMDECSGESLGSLSRSLAMWRAINPELLLYMFLPALIFGDAMLTNFHLFCKVVAQCVWLAFPGVLIGATLTGYAAHEVLGYGWDWNTSMAFGSILAATDPVAVVGLLDELGASPVLTLIISGESMLNDGSAMVLFYLFMDQKVESKSYTLTEALSFLAKLAGGGTVVGILFGLLACILLKKLNRKLEAGDGMLQFAVTLLIAYSSFYVADHELGVSGVLSTVFAAFVVAFQGWGLVLQPESMEIIWTALEWIGNTLLFTLAGLMISTPLFQHSTLGWNVSPLDFAKALMFFVIVLIVRMVVVFTSYPLLRRWGYGLTLKDCVVMSWGGLRGAVGVALSIHMASTLQSLPDNDSMHHGTQIVFHVCVFATLTMLVNGVTCGPLLRFMGMVQATAVQELTMSSISERLFIFTAERYQALAPESYYKYHTKEAVVGMVSMLQDKKTEHASHEGISEEDQLETLRILFLNAVKAGYDLQIEEGVLPQDTLTMVEQGFILKLSADVAMDSAREGRPMDDWVVVQSTFCKPENASAKHALPPLLSVHRGSMKDRYNQQVYLVLCFIRAHRSAAEKIKLYNWPLADKVIEESLVQVHAAEAVLKQIGEQIISETQSMQLASILLHDHIDYVEKLGQSGILQHKDVEEMLEMTKNDMIKLTSMREKQEDGLFFAGKYKVLNEEPAPFNAGRADSLLSELETKFPSPPRK